MLDALTRGDLGPVAQNRVPQSWDGNCPTPSHTAHRLSRCSMGSAVNTRWSLEIVGTRSGRVFSIRHLRWPSRRSTSSPRTRGRTRRRQRRLSPPAPTGEWRRDAWPPLADDRTEHHRTRPACSRGFRVRVAGNVSKVDTPRLKSIGRDGSLLVGQRRKRPSRHAPRTLKTDMEAYLKTQGLRRE